MTRDTSGASYASLKYSGILGDLQAKAYRLIEENPGKTANELRVIEQKARPGADHEYYESLDKRFSELERWGAVVSTEKRKCTESDKLCHTWYATGTEPVKPAPRENKNKIIDTSGLILRAILRKAENTNTIDISDLKSLIQETVTKINTVLGEPQK